VRVLDVAAGGGRHSLAAAALGADVTAVDQDPARLELGRSAARELGVAINWVQWDLTSSPPPLGTFDVLLIFNYLDRERLPRLLEFLRPGGHLLMETFLEDQLTYDWGPTSPDHVLRRGELPGLLAPLEVIHGREAIEPVDGVRWSAVASVLARKLS
jgi:2-polyprenyl-3-methyl-5-hydroxy-6-metoxy-1,4-benzoquinol methylase